MVKWEMPYLDAEKKREYDRIRYLAKRSVLETAKPVDPIELLDEPTVAYLAGFTDADGSIYCTHTNKRKSYYPQVVWATTHKPTIEWIAALLNGRTTVRNNHTNMRRGETTWGKSTFKDQWKTQVTGKRAQMLCQRMLPYLRTKREQAALVLLFPVDARLAPGVLLSEDIRQERIRLSQAISALNHT